MIMPSAKKRIATTMNGPMVEEFTAIYKNIVAFAALEKLGYMLETLSI